jgi:predicted ABC-class ATPase
VALADFITRTAAGALARTAAGALARTAAHALRETGGQGDGGSGRSGELHIDAGGQEVLERSAVVLTDDFVELRLEAGLPARGRRILATAAGRLLTKTIPDGATAALSWAALDRDAAERFVTCVEHQEHVRAALRDRGLVAFVGNGAVLPRASGASDLPLEGDSVVAFQSPPELEVRFELPSPDSRSGAREVAGMGVPAGVTVVVGGGYHGKSTLLRAIERGVYPHVPGDGREWVVSDPALVKVRAEDGRRVASVDIHGFIDALPGGRDTRCFSTEDASGSTSQAAAILEAVEAGATGLLLDEDSSASNFMVRDARMQALVSRDSEPITPFVDRVRELYERFGVSSILVTGGSGDYLDVADRVIAMRDYAAAEVTGQARQVAERLPTRRAREVRAALELGRSRVPAADSLDASRGRRPVRLDVPERDLVVYGRQRLELRALEQLVDRSQTRAVACAIHHLSRHSMDGERDVASLLDTLDALLDERGLDAIDPFAGAGRPGAHPGNLARPRRFEVAAALNRLRGVRFGTGTLR